MADNRDCISEIMKYHEEGMLLNEEVVTKTISAMFLFGPSSVWDSVPSWVQGEIITLLGEFKEEIVQEKDGGLVEIKLNDEERLVCSWLKENHYI